MFLEVYPQVLGVSTHKCCSKCGELKPATAEYFAPREGGIFRAQCRQCMSSIKKAYADANKDRIAATGKTYREANKEKRSATYKAWREANPEHRAAYREANKEHAAEVNKVWRAANQERLHANYRRWETSNPDESRAKHNRRRARKLSLPNNFTAADWQSALEHFNHSCAVCGQGLLFFSNQDHWIPLKSSDCPGTVPHNMVPLCNVCNSSKKDSMPAEWLIRKFGKRKGTAILRRVETYLDSRISNETTSEEA